MRNCDSTLGAPSECVIHGETMPICIAGKHSPSKITWKILIAYQMEERCCQEANPKKTAALCALRTKLSTYEFEIESLQHPTRPPTTPTISTNSLVHPSVR